MVVESEPENLEVSETEAGEPVGSEIGALVRRREEVQEVGWRVP